MSYSDLTQPYRPAVTLPYFWLGESAYDIAKWAEEQSILRREAPEELPDG